MPSTWSTVWTCLISSMPGRTSGMHPAYPRQLRNSLTNAITRLDDALDAVADLTLAESVDQLIRGNLLRAGATLDSIARGDTPPTRCRWLTLREVEPVWHIGC